MKRHRRSLKIIVTDYNIKDFPIDTMELDSFWQPLLRETTKNKKKTIK
jgi:hypothetical protein